MLLASQSCFQFIGLVVAVGLIVDLVIGSKVSIALENAVGLCI